VCVCVCVCVCHIIVIQMLEFVFICLNVFIYFVSTNDINPADVCICVCVDDAVRFHWPIGYVRCHVDVLTHLTRCSLSVDRRCPASSVLSGDGGASAVRGEDQRPDASGAAAGTGGHHHLSESSGEKGLFARRRSDTGRNRTNTLTHSIRLALVSGMFFFFKEKMSKALGFPFLTYKISSRLLLFRSPV